MAQEEDVGSKTSEAQTSEAQSALVKSDGAISTKFTLAAEHFLAFMQMFLQSFAFGFLALFQKRGAERLGSMIKERKIASPSAMVFFGAIVTAAIINYKVVLVAMIKPELDKLGNTSDIPELSMGGGLWVSAALAVVMFLVSATIGIICAKSLESRFGPKQICQEPHLTGHRISLPIGFAAWITYMVTFCWLLVVVASRFDDFFNYLSNSHMFTALPIHPSGFAIKNGSLGIVVVVLGLRLAALIGYAGRDREGKAYQTLLAFAVKIIGVEVTVIIMGLLAMKQLQLVDKMVFQHEQLVSQMINKAPFITNATMYCSNTVVGNDAGVECNTVLQNLEATPFGILSAMPLKLDNIIKSEKLNAIELDKMVVKESFSGGLPQQLQKDAVITYKVDFASVAVFCKLVRVGTAEQGRLRLEYSVKGLDYYDVNGYWEKRPTFDKAAVWNIAGNAMQNRVKCPASKEGK